MKKAIIAGDLHILKKSGMWSGRAEISGDDIHALEQIAQLAKKNDADLYLLGDVLDSVTNLPRPIVAVQEALGKLAADNRLFYLQGQHELSIGAHYENRPWLSLIPGANHLGHVSFEFYGMKAYGLDYFPLAFEALELAKVPKDIEVLFLHGTIDVAMPMAFHFTADKLKELKKLRYIFAGDYHQPLSLRVGDAAMFYTGSTWQTSIDEPREKSVILVTKSKVSGLEIERLPLNTRRIIKLSECYDDQGNFMANALALQDPNADKLPKELQMPVLLVDRPAGPEMYEELSKYAHLYTTSAANPDVPTQATMAGAMKLSDDQILQQYVDKAKCPDQFAFTLDVIESPVDQAVKRLKDKFGIKDVDRTVQAAPTEINLDAGEEEEVLA